jgi:hypothetical protein
LTVFENEVLRKFGCRGDEVTKARRNYNVGRNKELNNLKDVCSWMTLWSLVLIYIPDAIIVIFTAVRTSNSVI